MAIPDGFGRDYRSAVLALDPPASVVKLAWYLVDTAYIKDTLTFSVGLRMIEGETHQFSSAVRSARDWLTERGLLEYETNGRGPASRTEWSLQHRLCADRPAHSDAPEDARADARADAPEDALTGPRTNPNPNPNPKKPFSDEESEQPKPPPRVAPKSGPTRITTGTIADAVPGYFTKRLEQWQRNTGDEEAA